MNAPVITFTTAAEGVIDVAPARHLIVVTWRDVLLQNDQIFWPLFRYLSLATDAGHEVIVTEKRPTVSRPEAMREQINTLLKLSASGQLNYAPLHFAFKDELRDVTSAMGFERALIVFDRQVKELAGKDRYIEAIFLEEISGPQLSPHLQVYAGVLGFADKWQVASGQKMYPAARLSQCNRS